MDLFLAAPRNMKWLRNRKSDAGKTYIYVFRGLRVKQVELKSEAFTGGVLESASNNFAKLAKKIYDEAAF